MCGFPNGSWHVYLKTGVGEGKQSTSKFLEKNVLTTYISTIENQTFFVSRQ
jgi:hypothetical protein